MPPRTTAGHNARLRCYLPASCFVSDSPYHELASGQGGGHFGDAKSRSYCGASHRSEDEGGVAQVLK